MITIKIASEFSTLPGPRYRHEGAHSGEEFREKILRPAYERAVAAGEQLLIDLDGVAFGYPTSFLEEAFGGLARLVGADAALAVLRFVSTAEPLLPREIQHYMKNAHLTSRERAKRSEVNA